MNHWKIVRKYLFHFIVYFLISMIIIAFSVLINLSGPQEAKFYDTSWEHIEPYVPETNVTYNVLFDQHSHTKYSDGVLTVRQNIEWHVSMGYTAIAITDHNNLRNSEDIQELAVEYKNEIIVIQGMEWTTNRIHMNFVGISYWNLKIPINPTDLEIQEAISEAHNQGGIVTANHLVHSIEAVGDAVPSRDKLLSWGVDYIEIFNGQEYDEDSYQFSLDNNNSIGMISGTDMHSPVRTDHGRVFAWTALNTDNFTEEAVMKELRIRNTTLIYNPEGVEDQGNYGKSATYIALRPFYDIGEALEDYYSGMGKLNSAALSIFFVYLFGLFAVIELIPIINRKLKQRKKVKESSEEML